MEGAKIYGQNAIRKKTEQLNYMKLASRLDAVVSRLDTQAKMQMVGKVGTSKSELDCLSLTENIPLIHVPYYPEHVEYREELGEKY